MAQTKVRTEQVFTPGKNTTLTYVERQHDKAAAGLRKHIRRGGFVVSVVGPTKMGKTVLVQKEAPSAFMIHGNAIAEVDDFWERLAGFLDIPTSTSRSKVTSDRSKWGFLSRLSLFGIGEAGADVGGEHAVDKGTSANHTVNADQAALEAVRLIKKAGGQFTIVIDDFHFVPPAVRKSLVQALKPLAFEGATIILITLPHRRTETSDLVSDMSGRTATVEVNPWAADDLASIATLGFARLNLRDLGDALASTLADASYGSPQIMQQLCLELCETVNNVFETQTSLTLLAAPADWAEFYRELRDDAAVKWVARFIAGPAVRGSKRKMHELIDGREVDGYQVILAALKELGPPLDLTVPELNAQIDKMLKTSRAAQLAVGGKLTQMSTLASKPLSAELAETEDEDDEIILAAVDDDPASGTPQPVFEYIPGATGTTIHILEPYLAYTIRWHLEALLHEAMPIQSTGD